MSAQVYFPGGENLDPAVWAALRAILTNIVERVMTASANGSPVSLSRRSTTEPPLEVEAEARVLRTEEWTITIGQV